MARRQKVKRMFAGADVALDRAYLDPNYEPKTNLPPPVMEAIKGLAAKNAGKMARGGVVTRGDGIASRGKTKGRMV
jgi:hypothetical protein